MQFIVKALTWARGLIRYQIFWRSRLSCCCAAVSIWASNSSTRNIKYQISSSQISNIKYFEYLHLNTKLYHTNSQSQASSSSNQWKQVECWGYIIYFGSEINLWLSCFDINRNWERGFAENELDWSWPWNLYPITNATEGFNSIFWNGTIWCFIFDLANPVWPWNFLEHQFKKGQRAV